MSSSAEKGRKYVPARVPFTSEGSQNSRDFQAMPTPTPRRPTTVKDNIVVDHSIKFDHKSTSSQQFQHVST